MIRSYIRCNVTSDVQTHHITYNRKSHCYCRSLNCYCEYVEVMSYINNSNTTPCSLSSCDTGWSVLCTFLLATHFLPQKLGHDSKYDGQNLHYGIVCCFILSIFYNELYILASLHMTQKDATDVICAQKSFPGSSLFDLVINCPMSSNRETH